jgi:hypothetical protein
LDTGRIIAVDPVAYHYSNSSLVDRSCKGNRGYGDLLRPVEGPAFSKIARVGDVPRITIPPIDIDVNRRQIAMIIAIVLYTSHSHAKIYVGLVTVTTAKISDRCGLDNIVSECGMYECRVIMSVWH